MAYPLINPYQQFFDSSGAPLAGGSVEFRDPVSNALINSYPTADDADAQTNANDNPLTLAATGAAPTGLYLENGVDYKVILKDSSGNIITTQDDVLCPSDGYPQSSLESAAGIVPTDKTYEWGNVFRYGAVADSGSGSQGTDNAAAFQNALDSGHTAYVPEGWYSVESTLVMQSDGNWDGKHLKLSPGTRIEKYSNNQDPILHIYGESNYVEGNGGTFAQRAYGGLDRGLILVGADPNAADNTDVSVQRTQANWIADLFIIGKTSVTGYDGSIGIYYESPGRRRGQFITPSTFPTYYNRCEGVYVTQMDYGFFLSTDSNANSFNSCGVTSFGHAAIHCNGYGNHFTDLSIEKGNAEDSTERFTIHCGEKGSGPEETYTASDSDATQYTITGITKGTTTKLDVSADPTGTVAVADKIKVTGVVDSGAGDLEAALNTGHFEVTARDASSITISADTSGDSATWSSGGTVWDSIYPIIGANDNKFEGWCETAFNTSTQKIRLFYAPDPLARYSTGTPNFGDNQVFMTGTHVGGVAINGFSTRASVGKNHVITSPAGTRDFSGGDKVIGDWGFYPLADDPDKLDGVATSGFGSKYHRMYSGRMANMNKSPFTQPDTYTVLTVDNVGITTAGILLKLSYIFKESANFDSEGGEISWMCPVAASTGQQPVKIKDFQGSYNGGSQPYLTWDVVEGTGTAASTGKFELQVTMANVTGTDNGFLTWVVEILHVNLDGSNLEWEDDVTIQNGGASDTGGAE
jgi:hypothetical protein